MNCRSTTVPLLACVVLAACSTNEPSRERDSATNVAARVAASAPNPVPIPAPTPVASSGDAPAASTTSPLPLQRGVYVVAGSGCADPANAAIQIYDGNGLSGASTRACRNRVVSQDGDIYVTDQSCENTYDGTRTTQRQRLSITDDRHYTDIGNGGSVTYALCPRGTAPDYLEKIAG